MEHSEIVIRPDFIQMASGSFLCSHFPDNHGDWSDTERESFMQDNMWRPLEYTPTKEVMSYIEATALELESAYKLGVEHGRHRREV